MPVPSSRRVPAVALVVAALVLAGCSSSPRAASPTSAASHSSGTVTTASSPAADPAYGMPKAGQCYRLSPADALTATSTSPAVPCRRGHTSLVAYAGTLAQPVTPDTGLDQRRAVARQVCPAPFARAVGGTPAQRATTLLTWTFFTPTDEQLAKGASWVRCDVVARSGPGGTALVQLPAGPGPLLRGPVPDGLRACLNARGVDVACQLRHRFRVAAAYRQPGGYPGADYTAVARDRCKDLMGGYGGYWQPPSRADWAAGDHFVRCLAYDAG